MLLHPSCMNGTYPNYSSHHNMVKPIAHPLSSQKQRLKIHNLDKQSSSTGRNIILMIWGHTLQHPPYINPSSQPRKLTTRRVYGQKQAAAASHIINDWLAEQVDKVMDNSCSTQPSYLPDGFTMPTRRNAVSVSPLQNNHIERAEHDQEATISVFLSWPRIVNQSHLKSAFIYDSRMD